MDAIHRIFTGDEVAAAAMIPVANTQRKAMIEEMKRNGVGVLMRTFRFHGGYIDISINQLTTNIHIHVDPKGGFYYDFVATDHVTNKGALPYDPALYNQTEGKIIEQDGVYLLVFEDANTVLKAHGVEVKFKDIEVDASDKFPLQNPTLAPRYGKSIRPLSVTGKCSHSGLNDAPTKAHPSYPDGSSILTRMPWPEIWNVQAAPQYRWYGNNSMVVSGLKLSSANSMSWTQEAMGDFPSRKHADSAIDIGGDIDTQLFKDVKGRAKRTDKYNLDAEMAHSCVRVVDGVELFLVTDVKGDLYVYKTSDPADAPVYKKVEPPYPLWVSAYSYNARWTWDFNSDGTKMVAVPYNSEFSTDDIAVEDHEWDQDDSPNCGGQFLYPPEYYSLDDPEYFSDLWYFYNGHNGYIRKNTPGFVEFDININIVDGDIESVQLVLGRNDWYGDSGVYYTGAAYEYNTDALIVQTIEAYTDVALEGTPTSDSYMSTKYTDVSEDVHYQWTSTSGSYGSLEKIDVIWKMIRKEKNDEGVDLDDVIVSQETLLRDFPLAREQHVFNGLPGGGCSDKFASKLFDIYLLANTGNHGLTYFKYMQVIEACDMKSVTYAVRSYDYYNKGYRIISNGHLLKSGGDEVDMSNEASHLVPVTHPEILGYWASIHIKSDFFNFIDSHPDGHMAMCIPDYYQADAPIEAWWDNINLVPLDPPNEMIDYIRMADGSEGTHKDLFNRAFKTNRDYQFYYDPMYLGTYMIETTHEDRGSFASSGIWRKI